MNPIVRYPLLFIIWFGVVFGFYLHNKPAESLETEQPQQPKVEIRESEAQAMTLKVLQGKVNALEHDIDAKTQVLQDLESKNEALENQKPTHGKKTNSSKSKSEPSNSNTQAQQPVQSGPIVANIFGGKKRTTERQSSNSGTTVNSISPSDIRKYLSQAASRSRSCGRSGTLTLRVTIVNSGYVSKANAISGSFKGTPTERCIINQFKSQSFPKFKNPALVETTYTVNL